MSEHIVRQVVIGIGLCTDADPDPGKRLCSQMLHDVFESVVAPCAPLFAYAEPACLQVNIIGNDQQIFGGVRFEVMHDLLHGFPAQIHICHRFDKDHLPVSDPSFPDHGLPEPLRPADMVAVHEFIDHIKARIVP